jgi:hypothetical protein
VGEDDQAEFAALQETGLTGNQVDEYIETLGDIFVFRGTTKGFPGSLASQELAISPASIDPVIATMFAARGAADGPDPVVLVSSSRALGQNSIGMGNYLATLEREVGIQMAPEDVARRALAELPLADARAALSRMGYYVPTMIGSDAVLTQHLHQYQQGAREI